jgi:hypothetical protein
MGSRREAQHYCGAGGAREDCAPRVYQSTDDDGFWPCDLHPSDGRLEAATHVER